jgi:hypothetical protein
MLKEVPWKTKARSTVVLHGIAKFPWPSVCVPGIALCSVVASAGGMIKSARLSVRAREEILVPVSVIADLPVYPKDLPLMVTSSFY